MELLLELLTGICLSTLALCSFPDLKPPKAENVHWVSHDFKTILKWSAPPSNYTFTVMYSVEGSDWLSASHCIKIPHTECDLTDELQYQDKMFQADVQTEGSLGFDYEEFPNTESTHFNPYKQSELSAVTFSIQKVAERSVTLNISDPLSGIHTKGKQLSIRDILKKDLKYKVSYHKPTKKPWELEVDSNMPQIQKLNPGQSYCFMVAAFVPSRALPLQRGEWSAHICTSGSGVLDELDMGTVFQAIFIPLVLLIVVVIVLVFYCRFCRRKNKSPDAQTREPSGPTAQCSVV
ncbi:hypothetical protein NQD34_013329 [Periophthalmus magnuspinnatus]|nr:hypothetical protein NQD34_013329 [Periophthalmus magnuspinnatus]